jgi:hypothetical protein
MGIQLGHYNCSNLKWHAIAYVERLSEETDERERYGNIYVFGNFFSEEKFLPIQ